MVLRLWRRGGVTAAAVCVCDGRRNMRMAAVVRLCDGRRTLTLMQEETDHELKEMAREELHNLEAQLEQSENNLKVLLIPPDPL
ncbi:MAG: PCRF domain-containing protein, partial [Prevotella sp.]